MRKLFLQIVCFFFGGLFFLCDGWAQGVFISASDVVAGDSNQVRISGLLSKEEVGLTLVRPNKTEILFSAMADELGVVNAEIFGLHLREAGDYTLKIQRHFNPNDFLTQSFAVKPGVVSAYQSKIVIKNPSVEADGEADSFFIVKLRDAYGNFVKDRSVKVFSSRNDDVLVAEERSDAYGEISGRVRSQTPGVSILSVLAGDVLLFDKSEVVFYLSDTSMANVGSSDFGRFLKAQLMDDYESTVGFFSIEDLPEEVYVEKNYTFRVVAKDEDGNVAKNYTGKVRFASSDIQASLPADYTFTKEDQGVHTFALAVTFGKPGQHTFKVHDVSDYNIMASESVTVVDQELPQAPDPGSKKIEISAPKPGVFSSSRVTIAGEASGTEFLKIEDGPTVLVEDLDVELDGSFVYQTPALADGVHKFRVSSMEGDLVSEVISIQIDQTPPSVMAVEIDPPGNVGAGENFQVKLSSSEVLSSASCVFMEMETPLDAAGDKFVGTFQAPKECGTYPISCVIADLLNNKLEEPNAAVLQVCGEDGNNPDPVENPDGTSQPDNNGDGTDNPDAQENVAPTAVSNLSAQSGENKITLFWSPAKDDKVVTNYRVEFGKDREQLTQTNLVPDNRTQWYVDGLEDGTEYYFRVLALDAEGQTSVPSNVIQSTTLGENMHASAPKKNPTSGLSFWLPFLLAGFVGVLFFGGLRRS